MRANVKPLTHWIIYKQYTVRFAQRRAEAVTGTITRPDGSVAFCYNPQTMEIQLPECTVTINEYGWEIDTQ